MMSSAGAPERRVARPEVLRRAFSTTEALPGPKQRNPATIFRLSSLSTLKLASEADGLCNTFKRLESNSRLS